MLKEALVNTWGAGLDFRDLIGLDRNRPAMLGINPLPNRAHENDFSLVISFSHLYLKIWRKLRPCAQELLLLSLLLNSRKQSCRSLESFMA